MIWSSNLIGKIVSAFREIRRAQRRKKHEEEPLLNT